jgi:hypothetical protein
MAIENTEDGHCLALIARESDDPSLSSGGKFIFPLAAGKVFQLGFAVLGDVH